MKKIKQDRLIYFSEYNCLFKPYSEKIIKVELFKLRYTSW